LQNAYFYKSACRIARAGMTVTETNDFDRFSKNDISGGPAEAMLRDQAKSSKFEI
jgi:hypothetical protein